MSFELASAYVRIFVEDSAVNKSLGNIRNNLSGTTTSMQKGMAGVRTGMNGTMTQLNRGIIQFTRNFKKIAAPILQVPKWYMAAVTGLATRALHALYGDDSKAGRAWKRTFDVFKIRLNTEMARIANILLKVPIFGNTIPQWMDKLINFLHSMDLSRIKEMVNLFEKAAIAVATIKTISVIGTVLAGLTGLAKVLGASSIVKAAGLGAAAGGGLMGGAAIFKAIKNMISSGSLSPSMNAAMERQAYLAGKGPATATMRSAPGFKGVPIQVAQMELKLQGVITKLMSPLAFVGSLLKVLGKVIMGIINIPKAFISSANTLATAFAPLVESIKAVGIAFRTVMMSFGGIVLPFTLISVAFYGLRDAIQGVKIALTALRDVLYSIPGVKKTLEVTGKVIKNAPRVGGFLGATASGIGGALGAMTGKKNIKEIGASIVAGDISKAFNTASEDFFARNMFKKENEKWEAPDWKSMLPKREKISGNYMGLTEGVKYAQDVQKKEEEYLKQIASSTKELAKLAQGK